MHCAAKYPALLEEFDAAQKTVEKNTLGRRIRSTIGDLGARIVRDRIAARKLARTMEQSGMHGGFRAFGATARFSDILGCAEFLACHLRDATEQSERRVNQSHSAT